MAKRKPKFKRHPQADAWDKWIESEDGKRACEAHDFTPAGFWKYLQNRLAKAFSAGWDARDKRENQ